MKTVGMFLAMLTLARDGKISLVQDADLGDIRVITIQPAPPPVLPPAEPLPPA
jgi:chromatin segregation and condensation protein Rec8/ScpA/Scc1 (kleisin family)